MALAAGVEEVDFVTEKYQLMCELWIQVATRAFMIEFSHEN